MRIFKKTGVSTLINIIGMSVAYATAMILLVQVSWDATYDKNFEGHEKLYRLESNIADGGLFASYICRPLVEVIRGCSPNIEVIGTFGMEYDNLYFKEGERASAIYVPELSIDNQMFSVYPFKWVEGSAKGFTATSEAIISESYAEKIYGDESPVGKVLESTGGASYTIVGVFKDNPRNSSFNYGLLTNLGDDNFDNANEWSYSAYFKLYDSSQAGKTEEEIRDCVVKYFEDQNGGEIQDEETLAYLRQSFRLRNLHAAHYERDVRASEVSANRGITLTLAFISLLLIIIAVINFINFAFAEVPLRIRAINTRKVLGESRASLILRQLFHAALVSMAAFVLAMAIVQVVSGTSWSSFVSGSIKIQDNLSIVLLTLAVAIVSSLIAGIAPAMYSTGQPTAMVLKGHYAMGVKGRGLRNVLISVQFILSFVFIITAMSVSRQTRYMESRDMGFDQARVLQVRCGSWAGSSYRALEDKLLQSPMVQAVTFADNFFVSDEKMAWGRTDDAGEQVFLEVLPVEDNFVEFFGLQITQGRDFQASDNQNDKGSFIVNEEFLREYPSYHLGSILGGHVENCEIIGVVKDFNFKSLQHRMSPIALYNWGADPWRPFRIMYVRMAPGTDFQDVSRLIKDAVCDFDQSLNPDEVDVQHLDEYVERMYQSEHSLGEMITVASLIALIIAIIGIMGLVYFETQFMRREIAVRRVNGATVKDILSMICGKYVYMAAVSFVVAAPLAWWIVSEWRKGFAYQAPVSPLIFIIALLLVELVTVAIVSLQSLHAASANPVESLKNE